MLKKILAITLSLSICLSTATPAFAATTKLALAPDGMYPLRQVVESTGSKLTFNSKAQTLSINLPNGPLEINLKNQGMTLNGVPLKTKYTFKSIKGVTYVPKDFIQKSLGIQLAPDTDAKKVVLQSWPRSLETKGLPAPSLAIQTKISKYLTTAELNNQFSGQVLVAKGNQILLHRAYGEANHTTGAKNSVDSTFAVGSITKQMTAAAIIQLAQQQKLSYSDLLSKYLPNVPYADKITLHQLLTHTAGLYNITDVFGALDKVDISKINNDYLIGLIGTNPPRFEPGTKFEYSNTGYFLLGLVVEAVSKQTLETYMQDNLFKPAALNRTIAAINVNQDKITSKGYLGDKSTLDIGGLDNILLNVAGGAGNIASTTEDLYKWNNALYGGKIILPENVLYMSGQQPDLNPLQNYGYGLSFSQGDNGLEISHNGNTPGFTGYNGFFPDKQTQIIILSNTGYADLLTVKSAILSLLAGKEVTTSPSAPSFNVPESTLQKYVGNYEIPQLFKIKVTLKEGKLVLNADGFPVMTLSATSLTAFEERTNMLTVAFDSADKPTHLVLKRGALEFKADKVN